VSAGQMVTIGYSDPTTGNDANAVQDMAGNDANSLTAVAVINRTAALTPASSIDLGAFGKLIGPVQVEGKTYYHLDRNGNGTTAGDLFNRDGSPGFRLDEVFGLFKQDINGTVGSSTDDTHRFANINGVKLALPRLGTNASNGLINGTALADPSQVNSSYDDLSAIWDAYNGTFAGSYASKGLNSSNRGTGDATSGAPSAWVNDSYISATPLGGEYAFLRLYDGLVEPHANWAMNVALQVLEVNATILRTNGGADLSVDGSGSALPSQYTGGGGNDQLIGGAGNDVFKAGPGSDQMTGGSGADRFVFKQGDSPNGVSKQVDYSLATGFDWIKDFGAGDTLDLSGLTFNSTADAISNQQFGVLKGTFNSGTKTFSPVEGGMQALVLYDGQADSGFALTAILLDLSSSNLNLNTGTPGLIIGA
jgi:Ca2+-binding RTX toxin-like protein